MTRKRCKHGRKITKRKGCKKKPGPKRKSCKYGRTKNNKCKRKSRSKRKRRRRKLNSYIKFANKNRDVVWKELERRGTRPSRMVPLSGRRLGKLYRDRD